MKQNGAVGVWLGKGSGRWHLCRASGHLCFPSGWAAMHVVMNITYSKLCQLRAESVQHVDLICSPLFPMKAQITTTKTSPGTPGNRFCTSGSVSSSFCPLCSQGSSPPALLVLNTPTGNQRITTGNFAGCDLLSSFPAKSESLMFSLSL